MGYFISKKTKGELISFILGFSLIFICVILVTIGFTAAINYYLKYIRVISSFILIILGILMLIPLKLNIGILNSYVTSKVNKNTNNNSNDTETNLSIDNNDFGSECKPSSAKINNNSIRDKNNDNNHFQNTKTKANNNGLKLSKRSLTVGLLSSLAWSSCYGSYLIALISFSVSSGEPFYSGLNIIIYTIGFSISVFIIGFLISSINIEKIMAKTSLINRISGLLILIGGIYLLLVQIIGY
ncbi:MAG: cytochrome c biogenesis protein CcdA [Methanobacteriaceae archaeon]